MPKRTLKLVLLTLFLILIVHCDGTDHDYTMYYWLLDTLPTRP